MAEGIFSQLARACEALGVSLCGGHTEITSGIDRPIIAGLMLGEVEPARLVRTAGAQIGDAVVLTKGVAVEGTALIARERGAALAGDFDEAFLARCRQFLYRPGISVVPEARLLRHNADVHALHDPTEGGLATALHELASAAGVGLRVFAERIPVFPETALLCQRYGLDPMGLIASGALLATLPAEQAPAACAALTGAGIGATVIGEVTPASAGVRLEAGGQSRPLPTFARDEIARLLGETD
jgi:hydrogenase maturation factor